jgi:NAD(P)-dependent dehydrogenase (short-subunit alcohol dehydrogenase family)
MAKTWLITGSSRGFGRYLVEAVLAAGDNVLATARNPAVLEDLHQDAGSRLVTLEQDVMKPEHAVRGVNTAFDTFGRLDVLVNNAGYGLIGAFEEMTEEEFRGQIDTNFWGVVHTTRVAIPRLRQQGSGHIIQFTSVGGRGANAGLSGYNASKFAVEGFSESIAQELKSLGIKLTIVEPSGFRTDWGGSSMHYAAPMDAYEPSVGLLRKHIERNVGREAGDPRKAAAAVLAIARLEDAPLRLPLGKAAFSMLKHHYSNSLESLEQWASYTNSVDFDDVTDNGENAMVTAQRNLAK